MVRRVLVGGQNTTCQLRKNAGNVLVQVDIGLYCKRQKQERNQGIIKGCGEPPGRESHKAFQESILAYSDQSRRNGIVMRPVKEDKVNFRVVSQPVVSIEPRVESAVPSKLSPDVDRAHKRKEDH